MFHLTLFNQSENDYLPSLSDTMICSALPWGLPVWLSASSPLHTVSFCSLHLPPQLCSGDTVAHVTHQRVAIFSSRSYMTENSNMVGVLPAFPWPSQTIYHTCLCKLLAALKQISGLGHHTIPLSLWKQQHWGTYMTGVRNCWAPMRNSLLVASGELGSPGS